MIQYYVFLVSYQGDIQELLIIPDPNVAYEVCEYYTPDCDKPFPRGNDTYYNFTAIVSYYQWLPLSCLFEVKIKLYTLYTGKRIRTSYK